MTREPAHSLHLVVLLGASSVFGCAASKLDQAFPLPLGTPKHTLLSKLGEPIETRTASVSGETRQLLYFAEAKIDWLVFVPLGALFVDKLLDWSLLKLELGGDGELLGFLGWSSGRGSGRDIAQAMHWIRTEFPSHAELVKRLGPPDGHVRCPTALLTDCSAEQIFVWTETSSVSVFYSSAYDESARCLRVPVSATRWHEPTLSTEKWLKREDR